MTAKKKPAKKAAVNRRTSSPKPHQKSVEEIMARIIAQVGDSDEETFAEFKFAEPTKSRFNFKLPTIKLPSIQLPKLKKSDRLPRATPEPGDSKKSLPLVVAAAAVAIVIAGFWGPQIVRALGIPIDPKPFTAIYFQDPAIVETGIVAGDLIIFGVHNGFREPRNLTWRMESGSAPLARGQVSVNANSDAQIAVSTSRAIPGELLKIYIEGTIEPITIQVVG
jgi:hypothetical protein